MARIYIKVLCIEIFVAATSCMNVCQSAGKQPAEPFCTKKDVANTSALYMFSPNKSNPVMCECHVKINSGEDGDVIFDYVAGQNISNINVTFNDEIIRFKEKRMTLNAYQIVVIRLRTSQASNDSMVCAGVKAANSILKPIDVSCNEANATVTSTTTKPTQETTPATTPLSTKKELSSSKEATNHSTKGSTTAEPSSAEGTTTHLTPESTASNVSSSNVSVPESTPSSTGLVSTSGNDKATMTDGIIFPPKAGEKLNKGIIIAIAVGSFIMLTTIVTVILVRLRCKRHKCFEKPKDDANGTVKEPDIDMTENPLYVSSCEDDLGNRGAPVSDVITNDVDTSTVETDVVIPHDDLEYAQVLKREPLPKGVDL